MRKPEQLLRDVHMWGRLDTARVQVACWYSELRRAEEGREKSYRCQGSTFWGLMELKQGGTVEGRVPEQTSGHEQLDRRLAESKAQC